jgi:hypothetical protein
MTVDGHWSAPSLAQAVELAQGILPREFKTWAEVPGSSRRHEPATPTEPDSTGTED